MTLADRLRETAARLPDRVAVVAPPRRLTYREVDDRVDRAAAAFVGAGLEPGDRVGLLLGNSPAFVEALYGGLRAGLVVVPLNTAFTGSELSRILGDAGARAVVVGEAFREALAGIREALPSLEHVVVAGASAAAPGASTWGQFLAAAPEHAALPSVGDRDLALLAYTSGTTGRPKGAMLSHANLLANHEQLTGTRVRIEQDDVVLCVLPLSHLYALNVALAFTLSRGATAVLVDRFDPLSALETVVRERVSVIVGAPPMYVAWLNTPGADGFDLAGVRFGISGAAPLPRKVLRRCRDELGIIVWEGYGLTETSPVLTTMAMGDEPRPGSVGRALPEVELRLLDRDGAAVRDGDPGEVVVRGPNVFAGYWQQPEATAEVLAEDGWFRTGDVALQSDGDLFLVDRTSDLILVSGFNVYPHEVEEVLARHPKVAEAAVVGTPHPYTGEAVKAVVVLREGQEASVDEIHDFCRRTLARFKCPEVVAFAAALPHSASGKVVRRLLRDAGA